MYFLRGEKENLRIYEYNIRTRVILEKKLAVVNFKMFVGWQMSQIGKDTVYISGGNEESYSCF